MSSNNMEPTMFEICIIAMFCTALFIFPIPKEVLAIMITVLAYANLRWYKALQYWYKKVSI